MRTPEFIERCLAAGMPLALALTAAKAFEAEVEIALDELLDARRAKERARQAKHRAKKDNAGHAMSRDITLSSVTKRDLTGEPAQVVVLPSSLRSEDIPPATPKGVSAPKGAEASRGTRLPDGWRPDDEGHAYAVEVLGLDVDPERELDRFRDYWRAIPGAKGRKSDWPATWRNWVRRAAESLPRKAHERHHPNHASTAREDRLNRMLAGAVAAVDERTSDVG